MLRTPLGALLLAVAVTQLAIFSTTIYLHRALAHRAVTLSPGLVWFFRIVIWVTTGLRPREWVAVHRLHHAKSDEEGDPHSPRLLGYAKVQFGNAVLYKRAAAREDVVRKYAKDLPADRWDRRFLNHAVIGLGLGVVALCLILGPALGLLAAVVHAASYLLLSAAVNAIGHLWGKRPAANLAANAQWLAWLTGGEGLHNNHHAMPTAASFAFEKGQMDPGWWVIRLFEKAGWATVRLQPERVKARAAA